MVLNFEKKVLVQGLTMSPHVSGNGQLGTHHESPRNERVKKLRHTNYCGSRLVGGHWVCVILLTTCACMNQEICLSHLIKLNEIKRMLFKLTFCNIFNFFLVTSSSSWSWKVNAWQYCTCNDWRNSICQFAFLKRFSPNNLSPNHFLLTHRSEWPLCSCIEWVIRVSVVSPNAF